MTPAQSALKDVELSSTSSFIAEVDNAANERAGNESAVANEQIFNWSKVDQALTEAAIPYSPDLDSETALKKKFAFPGGVLLVGYKGKIAFSKAVGCQSILPRVRPATVDTVFDVSSLTKALVTTTLSMQLLDRGLLDIDRRLSRIFQTFGTLGKEKVTVRHLLNHSAGFPAVIPFYKNILKADRGERWGMMTSRGAVQMVYNEIFRAKLDRVPGASAVYSDVGFILLGAVLEICSGGQPLDKLAQKHIFKPLGLKSSGFIDLSRLKRRGMEPVADIIAATLNCPWREKMLCGEVHDDNAWAMGGIAGHAGLFTTAHEVHRIAQELINSYHGRSSFVAKSTVRNFWTKDESVPGSTWALGWDTPSAENSTAGKRLSKTAVGHLGYTGCSIWIDPVREVDVILLTNRIHPTDQNLSIREFRPMIHDLVMEALVY